MLSEEDVQMLIYFYMVLRISAIIPLYISPREHFSNLTQNHNTFCIEIVHAWHDFVMKKQPVTAS